MNATGFGSSDAARLRPKRETRAWSTTSVGDAPDTSPGELSDLGMHAEVCKKQRGRLFTVRCVVDTLRAFLAPRLMTTVLVAASLIVVAACL